MSIFSNPITSWAGLRERFSNVGATLKAAVTGQGVQSHTRSRTVNKILSTAASHPFATAGVGAIAAGPSTALAAGRTAVSSLGRSFAGSSLKTKAAVALTAPIAAGAIIQNPRIVGKATQLPGRLANVGTNIGKVTANPSRATVTELISDNPAIVGGTAAVGALLLGKGAVGSIGSAIGNQRVVGAIKESNKLPELKAISKGNAATDTFQTPPLSAPVAAAVIPTDASAPVLPATQKISGRVVSRRRRRTKRVAPRQSQNVRVQIINQSGNNIRRAS